jgi:hypothetical protein
MKEKIKQLEQRIERCESCVNFSLKNKEFRGGKNRRAVFQYTIDDVFINSFISISQAEAATGVNRSGIHHACTGKRQHAGGFRWRFKDTIRTAADDLPVLQFNSIGGLLNEYDNVDMAAGATGFTKKEIKKAIGKGRTLGGYVFQLKKD